MVVSLDLENRKTLAVRSIPVDGSFDHVSRRVQERDGRASTLGWHPHYRGDIFARNPLVGRDRSRGCVPLIPQVSLAQPPNSVLSGGGVKAAIIPLR